MDLSDLHTGEKAIITKVLGEGAFRKRILEMGFVKGKEVKVIKNAPLQDPIEYEIMGYKVTLRRSDAQKIHIDTDYDVSSLNESSTPFESMISNIDNSAANNTTKGNGKSDKTINVALVGNPNCGKTTFFNYVSGSNERVGNYGGVTIEEKVGKFKHNGYTINIVDLPGTYSISAYSPEELYVREHIINEKPDIVLNFIDTSNIERNLFLTTQLIDMEVKIVGALNMFDEFERSGDKFNYEHLGKMLGINFVPTVSSRHRGINKLLNTIIDVHTGKDSITRQIKINYGRHFETSLTEINTYLVEKCNINSKTRFIGIKLLENDTEYMHESYVDEELKSLLETERLKLKSEYKETCETIASDAKYGFIAGALKETYKAKNNNSKSKSDIIDNILTNKWLSFPIFIMFMFITFQVTFSLGNYPADWIDAGIESLKTICNNIFPDGSFKSLLVDGILSGVGGVLVFLPNILILFFFISLMEDTGYMSRVAFIMDRLMHRIGLHGKSFIPLLMGIGCNVPAIMATRTIEDKNNRLLTILINPLMSCSARAPVYAVFFGAFYSSHEGILALAIYAIGIITAILVALLFKKFLIKEKDLPFVMELPPYRIPTLKSTSIHMWNKGLQYLKKIGGIILVASIIIWFLGAYPRIPTDTLDAQIVKIEQSQKEALSNISDTEIINSINATYADSIKQIQNDFNAYEQENSYIGRLGKTIQPVVAPLGFDWKMGISILTGIAAKEVVVSTLGVLYHVGSDDDNNSGLKENLRNATNVDGSKTFTPPVIFSFIIFILIYFPCTGVIATIKKETGSWKWAMFTALYTTSLAWIMSFITYNIGMLFY